MLGCIEELQDEGLGGRVPRPERLGSEVLERARYRGKHVLEAWLQWLTACADHVLVPFQARFARALKTMVVLSTRVSPSAEDRGLARGSRM